MAVKKYREVFIKVYAAAICIVFMQAAGVNAAQFSITVDAGQHVGAWNRFYEQLISTDHMYTMLHSAYGRNMQNALRRAATECGFKYFRGHGIFNSDINLYSEPNGVPTYNWTTFDSVYDAALAMNLRPIIEFSFTPDAIQSQPVTSLWYNNHSGNISLPKDLNNWRDLCKSVVLHCESRYGPSEVRNWFFEVYNEPNMDNFFNGPPNDYFKLYDYASEGVRMADSLCKVGGPAIAGNDTTWISSFLKHVTTGNNNATSAKGSKCDFISYHRYAENSAVGNDASGLSNAQSMSDYHKEIIRSCNRYNFKGLVINDEWGPGAQTFVQRETEVCASFIAKTIHLLNSNGPDYPPPYMYGFWCLSDIYEEYNAWGISSNYTHTTAYDNPGNFGICLRGDPNIQDSWDVGKPSFNAFKMLHKMGTIQISDTGGTWGSGVNSFSTMSRDTSAIQIMLYNHYNFQGPADNVTLTVKNIPFANATISHFVLDTARSSTYRAWVTMGSPPIPTAAQWATLKAAEEIKYDDPVKTAVALTGNAYTETFEQRRYSVSLIVIQNSDRPIAVKEPARRSNFIDSRAGAVVKNGNLFVTLPWPGQQEIVLFNIQGALAFKTMADGRKTAIVSLPRLRHGPYLLRCGSGSSYLTTEVMICK